MAPGTSDSVRSTIMSETNTALKGMLIGIATVALPVVGFVAGRKFSEDAMRANPPPAVTIVKSVDKPCAPCPTCAPAAPTMAATAPPAVSTAAAAGTVTAAPGEGLLIVECVPSCVAIVLDGKEAGPSPLNLSLPPGKHKLFGKFASGAPKVADAVVVAGQTARVSMSPGAAASDEPPAPKAGGEGCNPPYWEQEDGTRIQKPACR